MNPFTESTVAQPLTESSDLSPGGEAVWSDAFADSSTNASAATPSASETKTAGQARCLAYAPAAGHARPARAGRPVLLRLAASLSGRRRSVRPMSSGRVRGGKTATVPFVRPKKCRSFFTSSLGAMGIAAGLNLAFPALALAVDVNAASQAQLEAVRGIGPKTAQIIIQERSRGGEYESFQDLSERVKGIGPKKAASLQASGLTVGAAKPGAAAGKAAMPPDNARAAKIRP